MKSTVSGVFEDLKFIIQETRSKIPVSALWLSQLNFWYQPSEILNLKSTNTNETLGHTPLSSQNLVKPLIYILLKGGGEEGI